MTIDEYLKKYPPRAMRVDGGIGTREFYYIDAESVIENISKLETQNAELADALQELMDWQNGPPLMSEKWETGWNKAMSKARVTLKKAEKG